MNNKANAYAAVASSSATPAMMQKEALTSFLAKMRRMDSEKRTVELVKDAVKGRAVFAELADGGVNAALPAAERDVLTKIFALNVSALDAYINDEAPKDLPDAIQLMEQLVESWH